MDHSPISKDVSVSLLGSLTVAVDGAILTDDVNRSQKLWNVLAYLIIHRDRAIAQAEFIEQFWPDEHSANPASALKTLLYRVRAMLTPLFGTEIDPITSQRGAYMWNKALPCTVDIDVFETLCRQAGDSARSPEARLALYRRADALYVGDFLPKLSDQMWTIPISAHLHGLYLQTTKAFAALLDSCACYEEMSAVCTRCAEIDQLDEEIHTLIVRALLQQGKNSAALAHYEATTDLLYRSLGVHPSPELRDLYTEIMREEQNLETDLGVIQCDLRETAARAGAFLCEYGFFKEAYRLEARRSARHGTCVHIALITVSLPDGSMPPLNVLGTTMDLLLAVIISSLRRGDVVSKYSGAQFVIMLPAANFEDSSMVLDRVVAAFTRQHRRNFLKLSYKIRALE